MIDLKSLNALSKYYNYEIKVLIIKKSNKKTIQGYIKKDIIKNQKFNQKSIIKAFIYQRKKFVFALVQLRQYLF